MTRAEIEGLVTCRMCGMLAHEDTIIGDNVCETCAEEHLLCACDNCGRVLMVGAATIHKEIGETGRIMTWRYCPACEKELSQ